jgi:hypothetical protein
MSESHSLEDLLKQLEKVVIRLEKLADPSVNTILTNTFSAPEEIPAVVEKHDMAVNVFFEKYLTLSQDIGGLVAEQVRKSPPLQKKKKTSEH